MQSYCTGKASYQSRQNQHANVFPICPQTDAVEGTPPSEQAAHINVPSKLVIVPLSGSEGARRLILPAPF